MADSKRYTESDSHKPDPTAMRGTLHTQGRTGFGDGVDMTSVSAAFEEDRRAAAQAIADGEANVLTDPNSETSEEDQEKDLQAKAEEDLKDLDDKAGDGLSDSERAAAEEDKNKDKDADKAPAKSGTKAGSTKSK